MTNADLQGMWTPVLDSLGAYLERIPDDVDGLDQPLWTGCFEAPDGAKDETCMTPRQLMVHCLVASWEVPYALATGEGFGAVKAASAELADAAPSALRAALAQRQQKMADFLAGLDQAALDAPRQSPLGEMSGAQALGRALLHLMHHKGQLSVFMRFLGVRPGRFL
jgi:uncharacterized damage-inducible protein DinB